MNRLTRNLIVVLLGVVSSLLTAAVVCFLELRFGRPLFSYTLWTYVPAGAIGVGLVAAAGYALGSHRMRMRPPRLMLLAIVAISVASVWVIDSVEYGMMWGRPQVSNLPAVGQFLATSFGNSPLKISFGGGSSDSGLGGSGSGKASDQMPSLAGESNAGVAGIGGGVSGMLASGNALSADNISSSMSGLEKRLQSMQSLGSTVMDHGLVLELAALQLAGFLIGGVLAFWYLRSLAYCEDCQEFLSKKGEQTRYFDWERDIQNSVSDFLTTVKARRFKQSIEAHSGAGTVEKRPSSEFASTVEISRCKGCLRHQLKFSARRKKGIAWKDISMLGYEAFCMEQIDVLTRTVSPTRIR